MAVIIPPGYAQVIVNLRSGRSSHACKNIYGWTLADSLTQAAVDEFCDDLAAAYKPVMNSASHFDGIRVLEGQDGGDPIEWNSTSSAGVGTTTGDLTSPQVMALLKKTTALSGRHNRGRTFVIDPKESWVNDDGSLNSTAISAYSTMADAVYSSGDIAFFGLMTILHSTSQVPTPVTTFTVEGQVATLRGRFPRT